MPSNGTALVTKFMFSTSNWTDDAESLPLTYLFAYALEAGGTNGLSPSSSTSQNYTSVLPMGYGDSFALPVVVSAQNNLGGEVICGR